MSSAAGGDPYAGAGAGWATGACRVYQPLSAALVARAPHPLGGRWVLDVGAGTGFASSELVAVGARPVAMDRSLDMLAWNRARRPPAAVADVSRLPLRDRAVDDVLAAFVLNHLADPDTALAELARVTRPGGALLASVFSATSRSRPRDRIDEAALAQGLNFPDWYVAMRADAEPLLGSAAAMAETVRSAGWRVCEIEEGPADVGVDTPEDLVDYRLGQAQFSGWLATLTPGRRSAVRQLLVDAVEPVMEPYRPVVVWLAAARL